MEKITFTGRKCRLLILGITGILLAGSCEELDDRLKEDQPVYFEYEYVNNAWGYQHYGWIMDREGTIRHFPYPEDRALPDSLGYTEADLEYNLSLTDSVLYRVDPDTLESYIRLIPGAAGGSLTEARSIAADAGSSRLRCYYYNESTGRYRTALLGMSGDVEQLNRSREARKLVRWLKQYGVFWIPEGP